LKTEEFQRKALELEQGGLTAPQTRVVAASWVLSPMVVGLGDRFMEFGDLSALLVMLGLIRVLPNPFLSPVLLFLSAFALYSFLIRLYYDLRYFGRDEEGQKVRHLVLLPPNTPSLYLEHEMLHVNMGDVEDVPAWRKVISLTPAGPVIAFLEAAIRERKVKSEQRARHKKASALFISMPNWILVPFGLVAVTPLVLILLEGF
jgi:hypothetical protein